MACGRFYAADFYWFSVILAFRLADWRDGSIAAGAGGAQVPNWPNGTP